MQGKHMGHTNTGKGRVLGKPLVCCTAGRPGQRAGWNLLRACESRERGSYGGDTPREDGEAAVSCEGVRVRGAQIFMSTRCTPEFMLSSRAVRVAPVARAPTTVHFAHFLTWNSAPTAPTAAPCPCAPSLLVAAVRTNRKSSDGSALAEKRARLVSAFVRRV